MLAEAWLRYYKTIFSLYFLAIIGVGAYVWYDSSYSVSWTQAQKDNYLNSIDTSVSFKEADFKRILDEVTIKREQYSLQMPEIKDIFNR